MARSHRDGTLETKLSTNVTPVVTRRLLHRTCGPACYPARFCPTDGASNTTELDKSRRPLGQNHGVGRYSSESSGAQKELGEVCCAIDSQVDRTFLLEVSLLSASAKLLRAVHHGRLPPKFSSNTRLTKGKLWPKKSIHSIKSSTVR